MSDKNIYDEKDNYNELEKTIPIAVKIIFILILLSLAIVVSSTIELNTFGLGDPYHCKECKNIQIACKMHRGFDKKEAIINELNTYILNYVPNEENKWSSLEFLYGAGNKINTKCDFCKEGNVECYGCSYNRLTYEQYADEITEDAIFISKLCDDCWQLKYANCYECRSMLLTEIKIKMNLQ